VRIKIETSSATQLTITGISMPSGNKFNLIPGDTLELDVTIDLDGASVPDEKVRVDGPAKAEPVPPATKPETACVDAW